MKAFNVAIVGVLFAAGNHPVRAAPPKIALTGPGDSYTTPAASAELAAICPRGRGYPTAWTWGPTQKNPEEATSGRPRIEQYRNGTLIATYKSFSDRTGCTEVGDGTDHTNPAGPAASGCGPFTREHSWRLWNPGDNFLVYAAVYSGDYNQPWIGPEYDDAADYAAGISHTPDDITVTGVVKGGRRPVILLDEPANNNTLGQAAVFFDQSTGFTMDNIDVLAGSGSAVGKAGVYELAASNLTLSNMRIARFARNGANGLFGAGDYTGSLTLAGVELDHNGGPNGPSHNAYIGASSLDPNFTVVMSHSWSHDAYYGHLFKSRAQVNIFTANYFQGGLPFGNHTQAEAYLLDISNGGILQARDNVFVKNASGPNSNGMSITFAMEGIIDSRSQSLDIENNTFTTFAEFYDGVNPNYPFSFFYPNIRPDQASWPLGIPTRIIKNAFVGYCPRGGGVPQDYRGDVFLTESLSETSRKFSFSTKVVANDELMSTFYPDYLPIVGTPDFAKLLSLLPKRKRMTVGAED